MCQRCAWSTATELETQYHDEVWGVPQTDDQTLFEYLILESAQAGLSWRTILEKREGYRRQYEGFDPHKVAQFDADKIESMLQDAGIVRHRGKLKASVKNARIFLELQKEHGSFAKYIWQFVNHNPVQNSWKDMGEVPGSTPESITMSKALKKLGMNFVGPTICYAFMQATGMVNDHEVNCIRYQPCKQLAETFSL